MCYSIPYNIIAESLKCREQSLKSYSRMLYPIKKNLICVPSPLLWYMPGAALQHSEGFTYCFHPNISTSLRLHTFSITDVMSFQTYSLRPPLMLGLLHTSNAESTVSACLSTHLNCSNKKKAFGIIGILLENKDELGRFNNLIMIILLIYEHKKVNIFQL